MLLSKYGYSYPFCPHNSTIARKGEINSGNGISYLLNLKNKNRQITSLNLSNQNMQREKLPQKTIYSSELLFKHFANNQILKKLTTIPNTKLVFILYTRNVFEHLTSVWGQLIARGNYTKCINTFLNTSFEGGRHTKRIKKI